MRWWRCVRRTGFNPVTDYLSKLRWDGVPRLDRWVVDYLGGRTPSLTGPSDGRLFIAGVRRPRQPGCKFDYIIVLEGPEGILKSTVIEILAGGKDNFNDQTIFGKKGLSRPKKNAWRLAL